MLSKRDARKIEVPAGVGWDVARHLANSRTPVTAVTLQGFVDVPLYRAHAILSEASEKMGWFRLIDVGMWQGRL